MKLVTMQGKNRWYKNKSLKIIKFHQEDKVCLWYRGSWYFM